MWGAAIQKLQKIGVFLHTTGNNAGINWECGESNRIYSNYAAESIVEHPESSSVGGESGEIQYKTPVFGPYWRKHAGKWERHVHTRNQGAQIPPHATLRACQKAVLPVSRGSHVDITWKSRAGSLCHV